MVQETGAIAVCRTRKNKQVDQGALTEHAAAMQQDLVQSFTCESRARRTRRRTGYLTISTIKHSAIMCCVAPTYDGGWAL